MLLAFIFCALHLQVRASDPAPQTERTWRFRLSTRIYKIGMVRSDVEKRLGGKALIEFDADHGFAALQDVYYELDSAWCAVISYRPADSPGTRPDAEPSTMRLVVQPRVVPNSPELLEQLRKKVAPAKP